MNMNRRFPSLAERQYQIYTFYRDLQETEKNDTEHVYDYVFKLSAVSLALATLKYRSGFFFFLFVDLDLVWVKIIISFEDIVKSSITIPKAF